MLLGQLCPIGTGLFDMLLDDKMLEINQTFTANDNEDAQGMEEENLFDDWVGSASPELDASGGAEGFTVNQKRRRSNVVVIINCVTILDCNYR